MVEAVQHYFTQSEQIRTSFKISVHPQDKNWKTGGIMIQQMPEEEPGDQGIEDWTRSAILLASCTEGEMLSPMLSSSDVLYRLFHEDGVRVYTPIHARFKCRCTRERVVDILRTIPRKEIEEICVKEGKVSITCEFCSEAYDFEASQLDSVYKEKK